MKMIAPNIASPMMKPMPVATLKTDERKRLERDDRLRGATLLQDECRQQHDRGEGQPENDRRSPGVLIATPAREQDQAGDPAGEQAGAEEVDACRCDGVCRCSRKMTTKHGDAAPIGMLM